MCHASLRVAADVGRPCFLKKNPALPGSDLSLSSLRECDQKRAFSFPVSSRYASPGFLYVHAQIRMSGCGRCPNNKQVEITEVVISARDDKRVWRRRERARERDDERLLRWRRRRLQQLAHVLRAFREVGRTAGFIPGVNLW